MNIFKMSKDELEQLSYTDIAYEILKKEDKQMKTLNLFKKVCKMLEISEEEMMELIGDFFTSLTTDKRFYSLPQGVWDLKEKNTNKIKINEDDEDMDSLDLEDEESEENDGTDEDDYSDESTDDYEEDDLEDLVIISSDDEETE